MTDRKTDGVGSLFLGADRTEARAFVAWFLARPKHLRLAFIREQAKSLGWSLTRDEPHPGSIDHDALWDERLGRGS